LVVLFSALVNLPPRVRPSPQRPAHPPARLPLASIQFLPFPLLPSRQSLPIRSATLRTSSLLSPPPVQPFAPCLLTDCALLPPLAAAAQISSRPADYRSPPASSTTDPTVILEPITGDTLTSRRCRSPSTHLRSHIDERSDPGGRNLPSTPAAQPRASCICRCHPFPLPEGRRVPPAPPWPPPSARPGSWTPPPPPTFLMPMDGRSRCRGRLRPLAPPSSSSPPRRCRRAAVAKSPASLSPRCRRISK
jgi:hypothetical protein